MPELDEAAFAAGMQQLRTKFIRSLSERIAPIEAYMDAPIADASTEQSARQALHRLAGAAGSLGFESLASAVHLLELHLQTAGKDEPARLIYAQLRASMDALTS